MEPQICQKPGCQKETSPTCYGLCKFHESELDQKHLEWRKESDKLIEAYLKGKDLGPGNRRKILDQKLSALYHLIFKATEKK